jgi:hypothetical protein
LDTDGGICAAPSYQIAKSSSDNNASNILAWSMPDEPDNVSGLGLTYGQVAADPEAIRAIAAERYRSFAILWAIT